MIWSRELRCMARAYRALPQRDREIFEAVRFEELDYIETATRHGCSIEDVERAIVRVMIALDRATEN